MNCQLTYESLDIIPEPLDGFSVTVRGVLQPIMQASPKLKNTFKKIMAVVAQSSTGYEELDNFMFSFCIIFFRFITHVQCHCYLH